MIKRRIAVFILSLTLALTTFPLSGGIGFAYSTEAEAGAPTETIGESTDPDSDGSVKEQTTDETNADLNNETSEGEEVSGTGEASEKDAAAAEEEDVEANANPPATVSTADSRSDGITLNLFDYDLPNNLQSGDSWENSPTPGPGSHGGWPTGGINENHNLKFFGQGGEPALSGNTNRFTGEATARQGIVDATLGADGYPVMTDFGGQSLSYLFDTSGSANKKVYSDVNHLFQKDSQGNYVYNSDKNYAYYDPSQGNGGDFKVYDGSYKIKETNYTGERTGNELPVGYFPFDDWDESKDDISPAMSSYLEPGKAYNHQHGLTMECDFTMPPSGRIEGDDIVFHFSGDDDAWLFVDDVLVMDIGGLHLPLGGDVNFTTGEVTIDSAVDVEPYDSSAKRIETIGTSKSLSAIFTAAGKTWDPAAKHHMKFFYLERGGRYSNLALATNVWKATGVRINVDKVWDDDKDHSADEVKVDLYADGEKVEGKTLTLNAANNWKDAFNGLPAENKEGEKITYTVKEQNVDNYIATYEQGGEVVKEKTYWVPIDAKDIKDGETYAITAPDWMNNNTPRIFEGTEGLVETAPVTLKDQTVPASDQQLIDDEGTYSQIMKGDPSADQLFVATKFDSDGVNPGTFWRFSNGAGNLTLVGNYHWWDNSYAYWYTMTGTESWDGANNYQGRLVVDAEDGGTAILSAYQYWGNNWGGLDRGADQYIYLHEVNGSGAATHPDPIWNRAWSAHVTFWKQVKVQETTELPDDWTITNSPAGDLTVSKKVEGSDSQKNREFTFVVKLDDESISGTYGDMTFQNGIAMFTLKHGESKTAQDLPVGIKYEVMESAGSDYTADITGEKGTIEAFSAAETSVTNKFKEEPPGDGDDVDGNDPDNSGGIDSEGNDDTSSETATGDTTDLLGLMALMTAALLGLLALVCFRRKEEQ